MASQGVYLQMVWPCIIYSHEDVYRVAKFTDLAPRCESTKISVHRLGVCSQSKVLDSACTKELKVKSYFLQVKVERALTVIGGVY